jgi:excisionase family DNA binding protein
MDETLTTPEAAAELGVSVRRVEALIKAGRLRARKAGRYWLIRRADLDPVRVRVRTGRPPKEPAPPAKPAPKRRPRGSA